MLTNLRSVKWESYGENMEIDLTGVDDVGTFKKLIVGQLLLFMIHITIICFLSVLTDFEAVGCLDWIVNSSITKL